MSIPLLAQLPDQVATVVLLILLIAVFVIAFKLMQMVFQTIIISVLSGAFYIALVMFFGFEFTFNQLLFYTFAGATLYTAYSFLASAYSIAHRVLEIPYKMFKILLYPFKLAYKEIKEEWKLSKLQKKMDKKKDHSPSDDSKDTKDVVLDKVRKDED